MAKKYYEEIPEKPWAGIPRKLPLKYHERAVIPSALVLGETGPWEYILEGGERVRFEYRCTCFNENGWNDAYWEEQCQELYKMSFEQVKEVWRRRIGKVDEWWNIVHMIKLN